MTGQCQVVNVRQSSSIPMLQTAVLGVRQELRPDTLGFSSNNGFTVFVSADGNRLRRSLASTISPA